MDLSKTRKLLLILVITAYVFSGSAQAWSWSWGSDQSGSNWGWGWGTDNSGSGSSGGSDSNVGGGSSWGWGWSSNGTDTSWGWGSSSGSNHSSGTGSTHNIHHNHTTPSNNSSGTGSSNNIQHNHTAPSNTSRGTGSTHNNHSSGSNHSSGRNGSSHNHTVPVSVRRKIEVTVWKNGFHYQKWASKHAPFYTNDVLVFKYNKKNDQSESKTKHSNKNDVYLLPDSRSYKRCDVSRGKKLAARGGSSLGFKLLLRKTQTYYLASGDLNGCIHNMKFSFSPIHRSSSLTKP